MTVAPAEFVDFAPPAIGQEEIEEVVAVLRSGWLSTGPRVDQFERAFATYVGASHAVAVSSCTAGLHLSLLAAGIEAGDEVVTTPLTFCSTANVIVHAGATPVLADVDRHTMNLTPESAAAAATPRTRALLPVHFGGRPVDTAGFRRCATRLGLRLIEDAAHCIEGVSGRAKIGTTADLTCFSFYATKNMTTGEGGMVTTASADWATRIRRSSLHGMSHGAWDRYGRSGGAPYDVVQPGFKYNMTDLQAALGIHQLAAIERRLIRREQIWRRYDAGLSMLPIRRPEPVPPGDRHARHLYTVLIDEQECGRSRDAVAAALHEQGIGTSVHFKAVHLHSYYAQRFNFKRGMFPVAEWISDRTLSLPLSSTLSDSAVDRIIDALHAALGRDSVTAHTMMAGPCSSRCIFRVAAGPRLGFGHLMRAGALARAMAVQPVLSMRGQPATRQVAADLGWTVLGRTADPFRGADLIVVDDPSPVHASAWLARARRRGIPRVTVHDLGIGSRDADLIVDGSVTHLGRDPLTRTLSGLRYYILDPRIAERRAAGALRARSTVRRVLIALGGGTHAFPVARKLVAALSRRCPDILIEVAAGLSRRRRPRLRGASWITRRDGLADALATCDVAVTAGGVTLYEACALGVPAVCIAVVPSQRAAIRAFAARGAVLDAGAPSESRAVIARAVAQVVTLLEDQAASRRLSRAAGRLVDGRGALRVARRIRTFCHPRRERSHG